MSDEKTISTIAQSLAQAITNKMESSVSEVVKESLELSDITDLATDSEIDTKLQNYVEKTNILRNNMLYNKYTNNNGSYALLFNESDGGGSQYYNKNADILSYIGTNDGGENDVCVQLYSKSKDGLISGYAANEGVRININPHGAYYTKGTNTSTTGGNTLNEIATKADIYALQQIIGELQAALAQAVDASGNPVYNIS